MRGTRYSRFIHGLQHAGILLNRKMLSQLAIEEPQVFDQLVELAASEVRHAAETAEDVSKKPEHNPAPSV